MKRVIAPFAAATLLVFSPVLALAQDGQGQGVVNETIVKVETPDGPRWLRLGEGVEIVDVTKGRAVRFHYEGDTIDAIEVTAEGAPVESNSADTTQSLGTLAPEVGGSETDEAADSRGEGEVADVIVRIDTVDGPRWYQLGRDVRAIDVTQGKTVRFSYAGDSIDAIVVTPEGAPVSSGN